MAKQYEGKHRKPENPPAKGSRQKGLVVRYTRPDPTTKPPGPVTPQEGEKPKNG